MVLKKSVVAEFVLIILLLSLFLLIRFLHFRESLNFSLDQSVWSSRALAIYRNREVTLVGPEYSLNVQGRRIFQGPFTYYLLILFLVPFKFNPVSASYLFTIFAGFATIPLFFGTKFLLGKKGAVLISIAYVLFPLFVDHSRFLWNGNFLLSLSVFTIFFLGLFYKTNKSLFLIPSFFIAGLSVQLHYLFLIVCALLFVFLFLIKRLNVRIFSISVFAVLLGSFPQILFELRNNFYTFRTLLIYVKNYQQVIAGGSIASHYLLVILPFALLFTAFFLRRKINQQVIAATILILSTLDIFLYLPMPEHGFGMSENWGYPEEEKVYETIRSQNLTNYNIANLVYDTKATAQKYLHQKDGVIIENGNYETNKYLFVISKDLENFNNFPYEVKYFFPFKVNGVWQINESYELFLLERL